MRLGPFGTTELGIMLLAALPWLIALSLATAGLHSLRRAARAQERMADALEHDRRVP
jgi:hypothetical protein